MSFTYRYPRPMVTVDMLMLRFREGKIELLLIQRDRPPYQGKWALPGGFIDMEETLQQSAERELREETGLENVPLYQLSSFGDPGRDPRGRTITILFGGFLPPPFPTVTAGDDARRAKWFLLDRLPDLAFDHSHVINTALQELKEHLFCRLWIFQFLPERFSAYDLKVLCEVWFGAKIQHEILLNEALKSAIIKRISNTTFYRMVMNKDFGKIHFTGF